MFPTFFKKTDDMPKVMQSEDLLSTKILENDNSPSLQTFSRSIQRPFVKPVFLSRSDNSESVFLFNEFPFYALNSNKRSLRFKPELPIVNEKKKRGFLKLAPKSDAIGNLDNCSQFEVKMMKCLLDDCMELFTSKNDLELHLDRLHNMLPYRCYLEDCGLSFFNAWHLKCHQDSDHGNLTSFTCAYCDQSMNSFLALDLHTVKCHHQGQFTCSACTFIGITRAEVLHHHTVTHPKSFLCNYPSCGRSFTRAVNLGCHRARAHKGTKVNKAKLYRCKWQNCQLKHKYSSYIVSHLKRTHLKSKPLEDPKMYIDATEN